jgi:hypothetical protein
VRCRYGFQFFAKSLDQPLKFTSDGSTALHRLFLLFFSLKGPAQQVTGAKCSRRFVCFFLFGLEEVRFGAKVWPLVLKILKSFFLISCSHAEFRPWRIPWTENRGSHFAVICSGGTNLVCSGSPKATETLTCPAQTRRADAANAGSVPSSCTNVPPSPLCMSSRGHEAKLH